MLLRASDILRIALSALYQQKVRTLLTLSGVVIGTWALSVTLSVGRGFEEAVLRLVERGDQLRQVAVFPHADVKESDMIQLKELDSVTGLSDARRERLRKGIIRRYRQRGTIKDPTNLTPERIAALRNLDHVVAVNPLVRESFEARFDQRKGPAVGIAAALHDKHLRERIIAGEYLPADDDRSIVVGEFFLYHCGLVTDAEVASVVGKRLRLEFRAGQPARAVMPFDWLENDGPDLSAEESAVLAKMIEKLPHARKELGLSIKEMGILKNLLQRFGPELTAAVDGGHALLTWRARAGALLAGAPGGPLALLPALYLRVDRPFYALELAGLLAGAAWEPLRALPLLYVNPAEPLWTAEFTITGVFREPVDEDDTLYLNSSMLTRNSDLYLGPTTARKVFELTTTSETGYDGLLLTVDHEENVKEVARQVKAMGLRDLSLGDWVKDIRVSTMLGTMVTSLLALVALLVACLGITNTMIMSVLERRREIGVMKAVGASERHIQTIFLLEGGLIGGIGGLLGIFGCWLVSFPGDSYARRILGDTNALHLRGTLFVFPIWLVLGVPLIGFLVTTLAAVYPARRAARVNPIAALRHE